MIKFYTLLLIIVGYCFALNDVTKPYNFLPRDTLKATKFNANYDTLYSRINQNNDSTDVGFIRWYDLNSHDSTVKYFKVDTIRSNPNIDSITGNVVITGSPIITGTLTADTLNLTKGINTTGGTFSGRVTGTDLQVTDSVKGVTGTFSGALTSATLNTGNGANELYPMNQAVLTTSNPTFNIINATILNSATLNTGYGDNELHPMNQGVRTTDDVTFDSTRTRVNVIDSIKLGTGSYIKNYVEGSFACTLKTNDVIVQQVGAITYTIIGNVVHLTFPFIYGTSNSTQLRLYCGGLTGLLDAGRFVCYDVPLITDNSISYPGTVTYMYGVGNYFAFVKKDGAAFTSSGNKGIGGWLTTNKTTITYTK